MRIFIALAAYNEGTKIGSVIDDLNSAGYNHIVICNDGSRDNTAEIASRKGAIVVSHPINRGAGAATATAIQACLKLSADVIVVMDADGQHSAKDVVKLVDTLLEKRVEVVIGGRMQKNKQMPFIRKIFNRLAGILTRILGGAKVVDTQSGFKAFSAHAARTIKIKSNGFEFCSEIVREIKTHNLSFIEIPIQVIYTEYSLSKGQSFYKGLKTAWRLFIRSIS